MKNKNKAIGKVLIWCLSVAMVLVTYQELALNLNSSLIVAGGDGIKNYYTYLYYILFDQGNHFSGMNYPFGEHILFTDNMPILSRGVSLVANWYPDIKNYSLGIMHGAILLSLVLSSVYLYKIVFYYTQSISWSIVASLFIAFFSPQLYKVYGHFAMAFTFFIPFTVYHLIRYQLSRRWLHALIIFLCATVLGFMHLYNLIIISILLLFYVLAHLITYRKNGWFTNLKFSTPLLIIAVVPLLITSGYIKLTDVITDRPSHPYGALTSFATGNDLFVADLPLGGIFQFAFGAPNITEGKAYIGIVSIIVLLALISYWIVAKLRRKSIANWFDMMSDFKLWLWLCFFLLLFTMGIPLFWLRDWLIDYISFFRQFRALGRLIWGFYYLLSIFVAVFLYRFAMHLKAKDQVKSCYFILCFTILLWGIQLVPQLGIHRAGVDKSPENYKNYYPAEADNWAHWLLQQGYDPKQFQAVLGLPFFHIGSEKIWIQDVNEGFNFFQLSKISLHTGLPIVNVMLSRTSWAQTFSLVNIIDGPFNKKNILEKFNTKPLLLYVNKSDLLKEKEEEWLRYATFIGEKEEHLVVYKVDMQQMRLGSKAYRDSVTKIVADQSDSEGLVNERQFFYANHFEHGKNTSVFAGKGSYQPIAQNDKETIDTIRIPPHLSDSLFNVSIWVRVDSSDYSSTYLELHQINEKGTLVNSTKLETKYATNVDHFWMLSETDFVLHAQTKSVVLVAISEKPAKSFLGLDELVLRPKGSIYFYKNSPEELWLNNRKQ